MDESRLIIDAHSHIGQDYYWRNATLSEYLKLLNNNHIDIGMLMPVPGATLPGDNLKRYFIWEKDNDGNTTYLSDFYGEVSKNPYILVNESTYSEIKHHGTKKRIEFVPLIHPILDNEDYLYYIKERYNPLALKIHGIGCGCCPKDISKDYINTLKKIDLPIIVHTDYCTNPGSPIEKLRKDNNPYDWAKFFIDNDLKGYLTHGCRVDLKTLELVNKNENLIVGIGPDLKISKERYRWIDNIKDKEYLKIIRDNLDKEKIVFDIDYSWNVRRKKYIDLHPMDRVNEVFTEEEKKYVLGLNAKKFFNIN